MPIRFVRARGRTTEVPECLAHLNLLAHAQLADLSLGSECGGHGICGKDRVRLDDIHQKYVSPVTGIERSHLTAQEIAQGYRLACQCFPEYDNVELVVYIL